LENASDALARIQAIIDHSVATAGPALRRHFVADGWVMSAEEFIDFWAAHPMASISTTSAKGVVHVAPLEPSFAMAASHIATPVDSQRLQDHKANPRSAIASWAGPHRAVIVY
jgi:hypothetical protein